MRIRIATVAIASALALMTAGCAGEESGSHDSAAKPAPARPVLPQKVPKPPALPEEELQPSPDSDAPLSTNLVYELRRRTINMARASGKTAGECPRDLKPKAGTKATCTITYEGLEVVWDVTIGEEPGMWDNLVQYQAVPRKGVLTRDGAAGLLYGNYDPELVRCNNIPKAVLVPLNAATTYTCQTVDKGEPGLVESVRVTEAGPRFF
ncbi:hypothetical protein [Streptomyces sp. NPDC001933]|uniref:hypothetical protein n=1 Tax=Streptomyces sp. NPDC001933 TaxID=3364626 RepID=UPI003673ABB4